MRIRAAAWLVGRALSTERRSAAALLLALAVPVGATVLFAGLGLAASRLVREELLPVDATILEVTPARLSFGPIGGGRIDGAALRRLRAQPGVARVWPKLEVRSTGTVRFEGDLLGRRLHMAAELMAVGVDGDYLKGGARGPSLAALDRFSDPGGDEPIPAVISSRLMSLYNASIAPSRGLPPVSHELLTGIEVSVRLGRSLFDSSSGAERVQGRLAYLAHSSRAPLAGVAIPLEAARRLNAALQVEGETYSGAAVQLSDPARLGTLLSTVAGMGLAVDDEARELAERVGGGVTLVTAAFLALAVLMCGVASSSIAHALYASVARRARELALMRAVGARRRDVGLLVAGEALVLGGAGGLLGVLLALLGGAAIERAARALIGPLPALGDDWLRFPVWLVAAGLLLGVLAALAGAVGPAREAAAIDPIRALSAG